jgi:hypothetical protein
MIRSRYARIDRVEGSSCFGLAEGVRVKTQVVSFRD